MFYELFCELCSKKGKTPSGVAKEIGFNRATITTWKNTGRAPKGELLIKIAEYFNVSIDYLLGETDKKNSPSLEELFAGDEKGLFIYNQIQVLPPEKKILAEEFLKYLASGGSREKK